MTAPTFVGETSEGGTGSSVSVPAPAGLQSGDHQLLVAIRGTSGGSTPSIPGFDLAGSFDGSGGDSSWQCLVYTASSSSVTGSIDVPNPNSGSNRLQVCARAAWRGGDGWLSSPAPSSTTRSASTSHALPTQDTTAADQLVVGVIAYDTGDGNDIATSFTAPPGWTPRPAVDEPADSTFERIAIGVFDIARTAAGTQSGTVGASRSDVAFVFAATLAPAGPPPEPPGTIFDLSRWKLTLPVEDPNDPGDALEVRQPELATYADEFFFLNATDEMVCRAPVLGGTTPGSDGTRAELREMQDGVEAAWSPFDTDGVRQLTVSMRPDPTGATPRPEAIVMQIHAGSNPVVYLASEYHVATPRIRVFKDTSSGSTTGVGNLVEGVTPADEITLRIRYDPFGGAGGQGRVSVFAAFGGEENLPATEDFGWDASEFFDTAGWYFKVGIYNKSETTASGAGGESTNTISHLELIQPGDLGAIVDGTATAPLGALSATAAGTRVTDGTAAASLGGLVATADGVVIPEVVTGTATAPLGGLVATATGSRTTAGTALATLGALSAQASGTRTTHGTASADLGGLSAVASGEVIAEVVPGTAVAQLGALAASATGTRVTTGTASATLGGLEATATGEGVAETIDGTATAPLGGLSAQATGTRITTGTASAQLGGLEATATGARLVVAIATAPLGGLTATADGQRTTDGTATAVLGGLVALATGDGVTVVTGTALAQLGGLMAVAFGDQVTPRPYAGEPIPRAGPHAGQPVVLSGLRAGIPAVRITPHAGVPVLGESSTT